MINGEVFLALRRTLLNLDARSNALAVGIIDFSVLTKIALEKSLQVDGNLGFNLPPFSLIVLKKWRTFI